MSITPADLVRTYLSTMERRDLATAKTMLAPGFHMVFPGGKRFDTLEQLVESSKARYRSAKKTYDRYDVLEGADGSAVIYCYGTLFGELNSGEAYSGIRFIDRFTLREGKFVDQMVWNDMAEVLGPKLKPAS